MVSHFIAIEAYLSSLDSVFLLVTFFASFFRVCFVLFCFFVLFAFLLTNGTLVKVIKARRSIIPFSFNE